MRLAFVVHMLNDDTLNSSHLNTELTLEKGKLYLSASPLKYDWYLLLT